MRAVRWLLVLAYGLVWLGAAIALGLRTPSPDWQAFYRTGVAVLEGTAWYGTPVGAVPNLTPPLVAPVFNPSWSLARVLAVAAGERSRRFKPRRSR